MRSNLVLMDGIVETGRDWIVLGEVVLIQMLALLFMLGCLAFISPPIPRASGGARSPHRRPKNILKHTIKS